MSQIFIKNWVKCVKFYPNFSADKHFPIHTLKQQRPAALGKTFTLLQVISNFLSIEALLGIAGHFSALLSALHYRALLSIRGLKLSPAT